MGAAFEYVFPCVTVTVCPATVRVPALGAPKFAATEYVTEPSPTPAAPLVIAIQLVLLAAAQVHPPMAVTTKVPPLAPVFGISMVSGLVATPDAAPPAGPRPLPFEA